MKNVEEIQQLVEYETTKLERLGKDFYNQIEGAMIEDKNDLRNYIIKRSKVFFEMWDFNLATKLDHTYVDVLRFKIFAKNAYLLKIKKIVTDYLQTQYPEVEVANEIFYFKMTQKYEFPH